MFSKVSIVGAAILITTVAASVVFQIREGFGDDERSVLVRETQTTPPANRYAEPKQFAQPEPRNDSAETPRNGAPRYEAPPRTASRSALVDRLKKGRPEETTPQTVPSRPIPSASASAAPGAEPVPFRRPGGLKTSEPDARAGNVAPPVAMQSERVNTSRRPLTTSNSPSDARASEPLTPPSSEAGVIMRSAGPVVVVDALGPKAIQLGKPATYIVRAANAGAHPAEETFVRIEIPATVQIVGYQPTLGEAQVIDNGDGTIRLDWRLDEMEARAQEQLEIVINAEDRSPVMLKMEWTSRPRQTTAQIEVQEPQLDVHVVGPRAVLYGQVEVYTVTVTNPGTGPAQNVVLDVALGNGPRESKRIGVIQPGGREVIKLELTAGDAGEMPILAAVRGDGGLAHEFEHRVVVRRAKLDIQVAGPPLKYAGSAATYAVTIRNTGDAPAESVEAAVQLPTGAKYVGGLAGAEQSRQKLGWRVGTLQPGDERTFKVRCDLSMAGENRFNAVASSSDQLQAATAFVTRVEAIADLKLIVNDPPGPQAVGDEVEYEITVLNRGTKSAQNVNVIAHFAPGVEPTGAEGIGFELGDGQVIFKPIPRLSPGQSMVLKVRARATSGGDHRFRAEVRCDEPNTQLSAEETTRYFGDSGVSTARRP